MGTHTPQRVSELRGIGNATKGGEYPRLQSLALVMPPRKRAKKALVYPMAGMYTVQVDQCVSDVAEIFQVQPQDIIDHATNYPNTRIVASTRFQMGSNM